MDDIFSKRNFMKCPRFDAIMAESDQQKGVHHPPHGKKIPGTSITLPGFDGVADNARYSDLLDARRSVRIFNDTPATQEELAFILWSAHGVQAYRGVNDAATLRTVPSGGARHAFEIYALVKNVTGLAPGLYHYAPMENVGEKRVCVEFLSEFPDYDARVEHMLAGQRWACKAPFVLFVSCVPYRAEWRYAAAAHRVMLIDLGHIGQNVMLSAAASGLGSCCIAAYDQALCDEALNLDGTDEYVVYAVPIGAPGKK